MNKNKVNKPLIAALIACVIVGIVCFMVGVNVGSGDATAHYEEEKNLNAALNRSELEGIALVDGPIYVVGHQSPDSDSVCSAIAYARLLEALGYDARPAVLGNINRETAFILKRTGIEEPEFLDDASACNIVLVDHSDYEQSAEGLADANVISIVDHHGDGSVRTGNQLIYDARPLGSTATIVWMRYRNYGVNLDSQTAELLFCAILSDTVGLTSSTTTLADREACKALAALASIEDTEEVYQEQFKASLSYEGMTDREIIESDLKTYENAGTTFAIGCVNVYDEKDAVAMAKRMKAVLPKLRKRLGVDMAFAQISIFHDGISMSFLVPSDDAAGDVLKEAFADEASFDGTSYVLNPGVSRKQVLVPVITDVLAMHPTE